MKSLSKLGIVLIAALLVALLIACILCRCDARREPGHDAAEAHLQQDMDDLSFLVQWLQNSEFSYISFKSTDNTAFIKFEHIPIPEDIQPTLDRLFKKGKYNIITLDREQNLVQFIYWGRFNDQKCGLAYALDHTMLPDVNYMTQCEPLSVEGWYYYFVDVNKWVLGETTAY